MKKSDLRTGMLVEYANGIIGKVYLNTHNGKDAIVGENGDYMNLMDYDEDLNFKMTDDFSSDILDNVSISKIYCNTFEYKLSSFDVSGYDVVFTNEVKGLTVREIEDKLGYKIKIIGDEI